MKIYNISPINKITYKKEPINFSGIKKKPNKTQMQQFADLRVFCHHIYEYKKGLRNLILTTEKSKYKDAIVQRLERENVDYMIHELGNNNINVYFGAKECVDVVKTFNSPKLREISPEQDFMLGIMLGYDKIQQCKRYLDILNGKIKIGKHAVE